jgi:hypothetical protein
MAREPGDEICPPWPWWMHWPGPPPPPWWDRELIKVGEKIFAALTLVNMAGKVADPRAALSLAKSGAEGITKGAQELTQLLNQAKG